MAKSLKKYSFIHFITIAYLIAAFSWWAILLYKKNEENYQLRTSIAQYENSTDTALINEKYQKQKNMILSEGLFFGLSILVGLMLIFRAFRKELEMNQTLNDFLLSVTHELKTPISSLKLVNQTLRRQNLSPDKKIDLLDTGWEESLRLESLVNNILTAAQIEQEYTFNFEKVDINELITQRSNRFSKLYPQRKISFGNTSTLIIEADKEAFIKVIDNLIHNAIKYSKEDEAIEIETSKSSNGISLQVKDTGIGIPTHESSKIWDKFYRVGNENTRDNQGTGLGLWITKEIVTAHKGLIEYKRNSPKGSIFSLSLPTPR